MSVCGPGSKSGVGGRKKGVLGRHCRKLLFQIVVVQFPVTRNGRAEISAACRDPGVVFCR